MIRDELDEVSKKINNNYFIQGEGILVLILIISAAILFAVGVIGYMANFIQFGLDQLMEAPSQYLGLFAHYVTWASCISYLLVSVVTDTLLYHSSQYQKIVLLTTPFLLATAASILLFVGCFKHHWFYREPGQYYNPYTTVCKVLKFARKHKYPIQRSAFTYCDDYRPTRLDFAKERFGGPFTTEEVENVKTLFRIVLLLLTLGPVHILQVPASQSVFPLFAYHIGYGIKEAHFYIRAARTGLLTVLSSNILFPMYIWCIFSVFKNRIPSMFKRLAIAIVLSLLGVTSMFITDAVGHSQNVASKAQHQCLFRVREYNYTREYQPLHLHWCVLIPSSIFLSIGPPLVTTTTLEFISAQSPHSMKGLLVGIFFALQGFFQLLGYIISLPFSITDSWTNSHPVPSIISCGFIYFLATGIIGLIGFILFLIVAKKYKYRRRDDNNFNQIKIEEVYVRYITQDNENNNGADE
jgi:peptide/histidine transporter 3/4